MQFMTKARVPRGSRPTAVLAAMLIAAGSLTWPAPAALAASPASVPAVKPAIEPALAPWVTCPQRRSNRVSINVVNLLPYPVTLQSSDIDCEDWSFSGNPSNIDGVQVGAGGRHRWTMEAARIGAGDRLRRWRVAATGGAEAGWTGSARLKLTRVSTFDNVFNFKLVGGKRETIGGRAFSCTSAIIAPTTDPPSTGLPSYTTRDINRLELVLFSDGSNIVMLACGP